jgi:hypothetical protein
MMSGKYPESFIFLTSVLARLCASLKPIKSHLNEVGSAGGYLFAAVIDIEYILILQKCFDGLLCGGEIQTSRADKIKMLTIWAVHVHISCFDKYRINN